MINGLEHISFWALIFVVLLAIAAIIFRKGTVVLASIATILLIGSFGMYAALMSAQGNVQEQYINYLKLQAKVAQYDDLDLFEQYKVRDDVMTYNLWYERNKSDLENEWTPKGTSAYAKEFDYIVIGD